jgi:hypothetical protein
MRNGKSPSGAGSTEYLPERVTACILTYVPEETGYFANRLDVLRLSLHSLLTNTDRGFDLMVFDNGSCRRVVDYLQSLHDQGIVRYLILSSQNIGIHGGLRIMFNAAPGEVIAYSQDDVCFYPGWLSASLEILDTFPKVGLVSGVAVRSQFGYGNQYLSGYLSDFPDMSVARGHFIPDVWEVEFYESTGRDGQSGLTGARSAYEDIVLEYKGIKAFSTAVHFQYVARKEVLLKGLSHSWSGRLMVGPDIEMDERIDSLGLARLSTYHRYVRHVGNAITPALKRSVTGLLPSRIRTWSAPAPWVASMIRRRLIRGVLKRLNSWSYFLLGHEPDKGQPQPPYDTAG